MKRSEVNRLSRTYTIDKEGLKLLAKQLKKSVLKTYLIEYIGKR